MIKHDYARPSDDPGQWEADQLDRQEVTYDWFWENGIDNDLALWTWADGASDLGLDPWRLREFDQVTSKHRLFVQRNQLRKANIPHETAPEKAIYL